MSGALSGHLIQSYNTMNPSLVSSGAMSFNASMHGAPYLSCGSSVPFAPSLSANETMSEETSMRIAGLQVKLNQKLGPEYISQRQGPKGGPKLTYAEGWKVINLANEIFGFNGWCSNVINVTTDFADRNESGRYSVGVTAIVRVTLREGAYHEDIGYGLAENSSSKGQALDKSKKEAVTDGLKRALRNFGNLMGNCLYDKAYTQEIVKMKVPPARFDKGELHRRPEFAEESKPTIISNTSSKSFNTSRPPAPASFNRNDSTVSSTSTSVPTIRESSTVGVGGGQGSPHVRVSNARQPANISNNSTTSSGSNISVQTAGSVSNRLVKPPLSRQQQMHQEPQQINRHVSFLETSASDLRVNGSAQRDAVKKIEPEDSFDFGDDEDFFAAFVAEECDLGRPIETEADTGHPIAHEESFLAPDEDSSMAVTNLPLVNDTLQTDRATRLQRLQQQIAKYSVKDTFTTSPPLQESTPKEQLHRSNTSSSHQIANDSRSIPLRLPNGMKNSNQAQQQQRNHRPPAQSTSVLNQPHQNEKSSSPLSSGSAKSGGKRTLPPSMGGFHFPPGVNPPQPYNSHVQIGPYGGGGAGTKRSADIMSGSNISGTSNSSGGQRSLRPGMGLQQAAPQPREPFKPLEVGEGGDVKRIKR